MSMKNRVDIFTAIVVLIVGLYDVAYAFNRRKQGANKVGIKLFMILGVIFIIGGLVMVVLALVNR